MECVEQVLEMNNNPHYLYRMTILRAISLLAPVMGPEITCSNLLPVVLADFDCNPLFLIFPIPDFAYGIDSCNSYDMMLW